MTDADLQKIADELGEPIEIVREMSDAIACCAAEGTDEAKGERRQRAAEAFHDTFPPPVAGGAMPTADEAERAIEALLDTAVRVRVDSDITQAVRDAHPDIMIKTTELKGMIETALRAAGFEVEQ